MKREEELRPAQAIKLLRTWQKRLRLQDWEIALSFVKSLDMSGPNLGEIKIYPDHRAADICLLREEDYPQNLPWYVDMESVLVHELLHIHFNPLSSPEKNVQEDAAIESIVPALINGWRRK